jgi:acyl-CoA thioesterase
VNAEATALEQTIDLRPVGDGRLTGAVPQGWDVRGVPHGGYLLALVAAAARTTVPHDDPLSVSATYLAAPEFGLIDLAVDVVRVGRRQSTATVRARQGDVDIVQATVTLGELADVGEPLLDDAAAPDGPTLEQCRKVMTDDDGEPMIQLHNHLDVRLAPEVGFPEGRQRGVPVIDGWIRLKDDDGPADPLALLVFSDGLPPSMFESVGLTGFHVPTVQLTTHLFSRPASGWIRTRCRTTVKGGSYVDEDCMLWDSAGHPVGTARQLALLR